MALISFSQRIADAAQTITYELVGKDVKGRAAYYFIKVPTGKHASFQQALTSGAFDLKTYGIVIASGFGTAVPEAVRMNVMSGNLDEAV